MILKYGPKTVNPSTNVMSFRGTGPLMEALLGQDEMLNLMEMSHLSESSVKWSDLGQFFKVSQ